MGCEANCWVVFFLCVREMMIMMINHLCLAFTFFPGTKGLWFGLKIAETLGSQDSLWIFPSSSGKNRSKDHAPGGFSGGCGWWQWLQWLWHGTQWPCGIFGGSFGCRSAQDMLICDGVDHYDLLLCKNTIYIYIIPSSSYYNSLKIKNRIGVALPFFLVGHNWILNCGNWESIGEQDGETMGSTPYQ